MPSVDHDIQRAQVVKTRETVFWFGAFSTEVGRAMQPPPTHGSVWLAREQRREQGVWVHCVKSTMDIYKTNFLIRLNDMSSFLLQPMHLESAILGCREAQHVPCLAREHLGQFVPG